MLTAWILSITTGVVMHFLRFDVNDLFIGVILSFTITIVVFICFFNKEQKA